ncbi:MAG: MarR family winged helix-turn-helix transcriptional regulator [Actinomycetota bacterium]
MRPECAHGRAAWPVFLRSCVMLMDRLDRQLQISVGIQFSWYEVLHQLNDAPGGRMAMRQLADSVMLSKSGVTRLVDRMAQAGLIERLACSDDGRVCYAVLTRPGRDLFQQAQPVALSNVEDYFARHITEQEAQVIAGALMRVLAAAQCPIEAANRAPGKSETQRLI